MTRTLAHALLAALAAASPLSARPEPTPLAPLEYPPPSPPAPAEVVPTVLPLDVSRLTSLGDFHLLARPDHLLPEPRCKAAAPRGMYRAGQGVLIYRLVAGHRIVPVGTGTVRELHPLDHGLERLVVGFRAAPLKLSANPKTRFDPKEMRADWEVGLGPKEVRYFTYPSNLTGMDFRDYERLAAGSLWVGMSRYQARMVMGQPMATHTAPSEFGWREVWKYPRSFEDHTALVFANDQLRLWKDSWSDRLPESERWSWQKRPSRNPWVGRDIGF